MFTNKQMSNISFMQNEINQKYKTKYLKLKKYMRFVVYENTALCDQITYLQDKILYTKEENNFLARKLHYMEFIKNASAGTDAIPNDNTKKTPVKRKLPMGPSTEPEIPKQPSKVKKPPKVVKKKQTLAVSEEACGQLTFPITLNNLTVHCLGEVATDRMTFHTEEIVYPVGYISTRVYGNINNPRQKCSYTCKITDAGIGPKFEICSENGLIFYGSTPDECHKKLLTLINNNYSSKVVNQNINRGAEFFGLANPTVHYLILSLPGVSKCLKYNFKKFNERINFQEDVLLKDDIDACINYDALVKVLPDMFTSAPFINKNHSWLPG